MAEFTYQCERGHAASHTDLFCSTCGSRVAPVRKPGTEERPAPAAGSAHSEPRTVVCPVGHANTSNDLFCGECGLEIKPASEATRQRTTKIYDNTTSTPQPKVRARRRRVLSSRTTRRILVPLVCVAVPLSAWVAVWAGSTLKKSRSTISTQTRETTAAVSGDPSLAQQGDTASAVGCVADQSSLDGALARDYVGAPVGDRFVLLTANLNRFLKIGMGGKYVYFQTTSAEPGWLQSVGIIYHCDAGTWKWVMLVDGPVECTGIGSEEDRAAIEGFGLCDRPEFH